MHNAIFEKFEKALNAERAAIVAGDFDALPALWAEKEKLLEDLPEIDVGKDALRVIGEGVARNQQLLEAAMRGVQIASETIKKIREIEAGSNVYGPNGKMSRMAVNGGGISIKA